MYKPRFNFKQLLCICLTAAAFSLSHTAQAAWGDSRLEKWMDKELYPYLKERLGQHPRLKGQPFSIVAMDGDNTLADINGLSAWVREEIREQLQGAPGVNLVWRPTVKPWNHPRSLADLNCAAAMNVNVQIGIDARWDEMGDELKVSVRALDLKEGAWVSDFGMRYEGSANKKELAALEDSEKDEHLRGLKPLPFQNNQADLLASYLAQNLSCLLRDVESSSYKLYAPAPTGEVPQLFATTMGIVDNYLGQFREVQLTSDPVEADVLLQTEVFAIDPSTGLYQVWVDVKRQADDSQVSGSQTQAYVRLTASDIANTVSGAPAGAGGSAIAGSGNWDRTGPLIESVSVVTVASPALCGSDNPWMLGEEPVTARDSLPSGGCFAFKVDMAQAALIYVFSQNAAGQMARLYPNDCNALGDLGGGHGLQAGQQLHIPQSNNGVLILDGNTGVERFHIVAVDDERAFTALETRVEDIPDICSGKLSDRETISGFEQAMSRLGAATKGHVQHQSVQFGHHQAPK